MNSSLIYCCNAIKQEINDPRVPLDYTPKYREYFIETTDPQIVRLIYICPWCGKKFLQSLRNQWFDILEKEYNLDDPWNKEQSKLVPAEFKTDEWWKSRKL